MNGDEVGGTVPASRLTQGSGEAGQIVMKEMKQSEIHLPESRSALVSGNCK